MEGTSIDAVHPAGVRTVIVQVDMGQVLNPPPVAVPDHATDPTVDAVAVQVKTPDAPAPREGIEAGVGPVTAAPTPHHLQMPAVTFADGEAPVFVTVIVMRNTCPDATGPHGALRLPMSGETGVAHASFESRDSAPKVSTATTR
jgi:hypothetical protein